MSATEAVIYVALGLGPGAVYAALGLGLVFTRRGTGVINLAYGAMAMYPTYVYAELRSSGDLALPGIPGTHDLGSQVSTVPAIAVALAVAALLGLLTYAVVIYPLRRAPPIACVVAAVGITIILQAVVSLRFGTDAIAVAPLLPTGGVRVADITLPVDRLYLVGMLAVALAAATLLYRKTRFGLVSRGATEEAEAAELLGYSPVQFGALNWIIGAVLAGLFGIMLAPLAGLSPSGYSLLVVPALVPALAGRLESAWATVAAGVTLGVLQSLATELRLPWDWLGPQTIRTVLPFVALVALLMVLGTPVPRRGTGHAPRLPAAPAQTHALRSTGAIFAVGSAAVVGLEGGYRSALTATSIGALLCLSLVILTGYAGQISLAQMSFAGIAGFFLSGATSDWGLPFPVAPLLAALVAAACGVIVGLPALRARGMTIAIMTLGAALAVEELIFRNLSKGILSSNDVPPARLLGLDLSATSDNGSPRAAFGVFVVAVLAVVSFGVLRLRMSGLGLQMLAVRGNERAAAAAGVSLRRTKLLAFGMSAFIAGIAGTLTGYHQGALSDQSFGISRSLVVLAVAYLGGIASVPGAIVGGLVIPGGLVPTFAERVFHLGRYESLFAGVAVVAVALRNPEGVASTLRRVWERVRMRDRVSRQT